MNDLRPPCWPEGHGCPNRCASQHYQRVVYGNTGLHGEFDGWRIAGRDLIAPGGGRLNVRLLAILARTDAAARRDARRGQQGEPKRRQRPLRGLTV